LNKGKYPLTDEEFFRIKAEFYKKYTGKKYPYSFIGYVDSHPIHPVGCWVDLFRNLFKKIKLNEGTGGK